MHAHEILRRTLVALDIDHAFGLPGTQNMAAFEALRTSAVRVVVPTHELSATFMANGYGRATGRPALVLSIAGPGFAYSLAAMAEALLDSAPLVHLTTTPPSHPRFTHLSQSIDQATMAGPVSKAVLEVRTLAELAPALEQARDLAIDGDPGPVLVQLDPAVMDQDAPWTEPSVLVRRGPHDEAIASLRARLAEASRPLLWVGQGALGAADGVRALAEVLSAPVLTTTSGRGILPESHPLSMGFEFSGTRVGAMNELIAASDLVLALGSRFSQNAMRRFQLKIDEKKLVHVDASAQSLGANQPAKWQIRADVGLTLRALLEGFSASGPGWPEPEIDRWKRRGLAESWEDAGEPRLLGGEASEFFGALGAALPETARVVTDSGLHQLMARRYLRVESPAGLVAPVDFQSMGFALPAAIATKLAVPDRHVVALMGDGGMIMNGMEILTAVQCGIDLSIVMINDASYGLIRRTQEGEYGAAPSSELPSPDFGALATGLGAGYVRLGSPSRSEVEEALNLPGVTLIEVSASESRGLRVTRAKGRVKRAMGPSVLRSLKNLTGR